MAETTKAIGIRIPLTLWAKIQEYGAEHHPKGDSFDVTQTLVTLLANALSIPLDDIVKRPTASDDHVVQLVRQELDKALVNARIGTHTDITADGLQTAIDEAIEQTIAPIQSDLAELLLRVDRLESNTISNPVVAMVISESLTKTNSSSAPSKTVGKPVSSSSQASKPKAAVTKPDGEVGKVVDRLLKDANLLRAVRAAITVGGTSSEIGDRLLKAGHGTVNGGPHSPAAISRFRAALAYLDGC
jgi:hypothetical protein